jgi:hypothetical protein
MFAYLTVGWSNLGVRAPFVQHDARDGFATWEQHNLFRPCEKTQEPTKKPFVMSTSPQLHLNLNSTLSYFSIHSRLSTTLGPVSKLVAITDIQYEVPHAFASDFSDIRYRRPH